MSALGHSRNNACRRFSSPGAAISTRGFLPPVQGAHYSSTTCIKQERPQADDWRGSWGLPPLHLKLSSPHRSYSALNSSISLIPLGGICSLGHPFLKLFRSNRVAWCEGVPFLQTEGSFSSRGPLEKRGAEGMKEPRQHVRTVGGKHATVRWAPVLPEWARRRIRMGGCPPPLILKVE